MNNAKEGTDFSDKSGVSEEWLERFMDSAGFVSAEDIQIIWGKILANELETLGVIKLVTIGGYITQGIENYRF